MLNQQLKLKQNGSKSFNAQNSRVEDFNLNKNIETIDSADEL